MPEENKNEENVSMGRGIVYSLAGAAIGAFFGSLRPSEMGLSLEDVAIMAGTGGLALFVSTKTIAKKSTSYALRATACTTFGIAVGETLGYYLNH